MVDPLPINESQEQQDTTSIHTETMSDTAAPAAVVLPVSTPTGIVTTSHVAVPTIPVIIHIHAVTGEKTSPKEFPRAMYPFGWSAADLQRWLALTFGAIIGLIFLWQVQTVLPPFLIAFSLAALLDPTLRYFERFGYSRVRSVLTLYIAGIAALGLFFAFIVPVVAAQVSDISDNMDTYNTEIRDNANRYMHDHTTLLDRLNIKQRTIEDLINQHSSPIRKAVSDVLGSVTAVLANLASKALWLVIIPIATFFFMRDYPMIRARLINLFPEQYHVNIDKMSRDVVDVFSAYIRGLTQICGLYSVVACLLFALLGLKYWLFLGLLAGVFYAVPYVGQLVTALGSGAVAYMMSAHRVLFVFPVEAHSIKYTLVVVVVAVMVQNIFDQILYPRLVGGSVGLNPVLSIFSLMAGATLFGVWGMLLAVPVAASLQILLVTFFPQITRRPDPALLQTPPPLA